MFEELAENKVFLDYIKGELSRAEALEIHKALTKEPNLSAADALKKSSPSNELIKILRTSREYAKSIKPLIKEKLELEKKLKIEEEKKGTSEVTVKTPLLALFDLSTMALNISQIIKGARELHLSTNAAVIMSLAIGSLAIQVIMVLLLLFLVFYNPTPRNTQTKPSPTIVKKESGQVPSSDEASDTLTDNSTKDEDSTKKNTKKVLSPTTEETKKVLSPTTEKKDKKKLQIKTDRKVEDSKKDKKTEKPITLQEQVNKRKARIDFMITLSYILLFGSVGINIAIAVLTPL
ncbi:hypothetical protein AKO1_003937 [Acrasis kona]|uniref:Uncharacterized protein n=1 Tax=Acrasis kona TaxID=1008807 RepID=A0AAW2ZKC2_9EUKA